MVIKKVHIEKYRGFRDVSFKLGDRINVIAGQNGTQKTTLLGILSQTFSIDPKKNPMGKEKPLCGGNFRSGFSEKFKLSERFDKAGEHEWTLDIKHYGEFPIESISRGKDKIRFWKKGDKGSGSGYYQCPVIFLSLKRLTPIGEEQNIREDSDISLTTDEIDFIKLWHCKILLTNNEIKSQNCLTSTNKNTIGVETEFYDWKLNSAGQDNIGKILLAVLSFKRLKEKFFADYQGGLLVIDELDATLYPASQLKLLDALLNFSRSYNFQVIFTTHSLTLLEEACRLKDDQHNKGQIGVLYLQKQDNKILVSEQSSYLSIKHHLNVTLETVKTNKIDVFTEDEEAVIFAKSLLKSKASKLNFINCNLGCSNIIELATKKVPSFSYPNSLIILDGDVKKSVGSMRKVNKLKNIIILPANLSPERLLAVFLDGKEEGSDVWDKIHPGYTKQICFRDVLKVEIIDNRKKAKEWFQGQYRYWGRNASKLVNLWIKENKEESRLFVEEFITKYNLFAKELHLQHISN